MTAEKGALEAAEAFIHAIQWSEHTTIWTLLSDAGRTTALSVAVDNGLDRVTAARIRDNVSDPRQLEDFFTRLLGGLRRDLRSVDIDQLEPGVLTCHPSNNSIDVELTNPSLLPGTDHWAAGHLVLTANEAGEWCVERLVPRIAGR